MRERPILPPTWEARPIGTYAEMEDALDRLRAELETEGTRANDLAMELAATRDASKRNLRTFGSHTSGCSMLQGIQSCSCGLVSALAAVPDEETQK